MARKKFDAGQIIGHLRTIWLMELVSPFHTAENKLNEHLLADLTQNVFKEQKFKLVAYGTPESARKVN